jgi:hypothetical protein
MPEVLYCLGIIGFVILVVVGQVRLAKHNVKQQRIVMRPAREFIKDLENDPEARAALFRIIQEEAARRKK